LDGLEFIYLEDSFVLDIVATPGAVKFEMDFVLTAEHPEYAQPNANEQYCYRRGSLNFERASECVWRDQGLPPARDADDELDFGNIDSFSWQSDSFSLEGDWGTMTIVASNARILLHPVT
jgi:hypothetical protein